MQPLRRHPPHKYDNNFNNMFQLLMRHSILRSAQARKNESKGSQWYPLVERKVPTKSLAVEWGVLRRQ